MKRQTLQAFPLVILIVICSWTAISWVFVRFVHYHAQRRILAPAHYTADVMPVADGSIDQGDSSEFRKSQDGRYYVRVATLGTAHHLESTTADLLVPFLLSLVGIVVSVRIQKRPGAEPDQQDHGA